VPATQVERAPCVRFGHVGADFQDVADLAGALLGFKGGEHAALERNARVDDGLLLGRERAAFQRFKDVGRTMRRRRWKGNWSARRT
jgi:hypothetical protein